MASDGWCNHLDYSDVFGEYQIKHATFGSVMGVANPNAFV